MNLDNRLTMVVVGIIAVALLAAGWFIGVQPQLQAAATADAQRATVTTQNDAVAAQIVELKKQKAKLPELSAQLATLAASIPATVDTTAFLRTVSALTASSGVELVSFTPSSGAAYVPPTGAAAPGAAAPGAAASGAPSASPSAATPAPASAPAAAPAVPTGGPYSDPAVSPENFTVVGFAIEVSGSEAAVDNFLNGLRNTTRLVLLTSINKSVTQTDGGGTAWSLSVSGNIYALSSPATNAAAANG